MAIILYQSIYELASEPEPTDRNQSKIFYEGADTVLKRCKLPYKIEKINFGVGVYTYSYRVQTLMHFTTENKKKESIVIKLYECL